MIGLAIALVVIGVVLLFLIPWIGLAVGIVGALLALAYLFGVGRRAVEPTEPSA
jgi:4-hydroxybenzoate polyprenyltransferase